MLKDDIVSFYHNAGIPDEYIMTDEEDGTSLICVGETNETGEYQLLITIPNDESMCEVSYGKRLELDRYDMMQLYKYINDLNYNSYGVVYYLSDNYLCVKSVEFNPAIENILGMIDLTSQCSNSYIASV